MTTRPESKPSEREDTGWETGGEDRLRRTAAVPLAQKLEWLEQMHRLALKLASGRQACHGTTPDEG